MRNCQWKKSWNKDLKFLQQWYTLFMKAYVDAGSVERWTWRVRTYCRIIDILQGRRVRMACGGQIVCDVNPASIFKGLEAKLIIVYLVGTGFYFTPIYTWNNFLFSQNIWLKRQILLYICMYMCVYIYIYSKLMYVHI